MRILYAVCSEGMGHATRSKVVIDHLKKQGHEVQVTAGERAYTYLLHDHNQVQYADSLYMYYRNNKASILLSTLKNTLNLPRLIKSAWVTHKQFKEFKPQLVITDYTFLAPWFAKWKKVPCIALANNYIFAYTRIGAGWRFTLGKSLVTLFTRLMTLPNYIINVTYFFPPVKAHLHKRITLCDPLIQDNIRNAHRHKKDHILVYQTSATNTRLIDDLKQISHDFIVYGMHKEGKEGNVEFKLFSEEFAKDLADAQAVITNGGFSLIAEALYLKKPVLSIPVKGQTEQELNAVFVERLGYGATITKSSVEEVKKFIKHKAKFAKALESYNPDPHQALHILDKKIKELLG